MMDPFLDYDMLKTERQIRQLLYLIKMYKIFFFLIFKGPRLKIWPPIFFICWVPKIEISMPKAPQGMWLRPHKVWSSHLFWGTRFAGKLSSEIRPLETGWKSFKVFSAPKGSPRHHLSTNLFFVYSFDLRFLSFIFVFQVVSILCICRVLTVFQQIFHKSYQTYSKYRKTKNGCIWSWTYFISIHISNI